MEKRKLVPRLKVYITTIMQNEMENEMENWIIQEFIASMLQIRRTCQLASSMASFPQLLYLEAKKLRSEKNSYSLQADLLIQLIQLNRGNLLFHCPSLWIQLDQKISEPLTAKQRSLLLVPKPLDPKTLHPKA